jgi:hypothetical protein
LAFKKGNDRWRRSWASELADDVRIEQKTSH